MGTTIKAASRPTAQATAKPAGPKLAERQPLLVVAQAAHPPSGTLLILHVDVRDATGTPVGGLDKQDFQVLQLPGGIGELPVTVMQDHGTTDSGRAGLYSLVFQSWSAPNPGLIAYRVHVRQGARNGVAMTSIMVD